MGYLFGDILAVPKADIAVIWGGAALAGGAVWLWRPLLAGTLNAEAAAAEGVPVRRNETAFILLIAVMVAVALKVVGILLITAILIFPTAVARPFARTPGQMASLAGLAGRRRCSAGCHRSLKLDTPAGPSIVVALAALFFFVAAPAPLLAGTDSPHLPCEALALYPASLRFGSRMNARAFSAMTIIAAPGGALGMQVSLLLYASG